MRKILEFGPVIAGISKNELKKIANSYITKRTIGSSSASFLAGIPGGFAMAATIPADLLQFFGISIRLAQELAYIYGAENFFVDDELNEETKGQIILYLGTMLGASGAAEGVRVISAQLSKQALKQLPKQALTKGFIYPLVKSIAKFLGIKLTKDTFAKGVAKVIPVIGGVISGGITFISMKPMGKRLQRVLEKARFSYSDAEYQADINSIKNAKFTNYDTKSVDIEFEEVPTKDTSSEDIPITQKTKDTPEAFEHNKSSELLLFDKINKYYLLYQEGDLTFNEFESIKNRIIRESELSWFQLKEILNIIIIKENIPL